MNYLISILATEYQIKNVSTIACMLYASMLQKEETFFKRMSEYEISISTQKNLSELRENIILNFKTKFEKYSRVSEAEARSLITKAFEKKHIKTKAFEDFFYLYMVSIMEKDLFVDFFNTALELLNNQDRIIFFKLVEEDLRSKLIHKIEEVVEEKKPNIIGPEVGDITQIVLYYSFEDFSTEYQIPKIKYNEDCGVTFLKKLKSEGAIMIGVYGTPAECQKVIQAIFGDKNLTLNCPGIQEGLLAVTDGQKTVLVYVQNEDIYSKDHKADSNNLAVTYIRYLVDFCPDIIIARDKNIGLKLDIENPFGEKPHPGYCFQEQNEEIRRSDITSLEIHRLNESPNYQFGLLNLSNDLTPQAVEGDFKKEKKTVPVKKEVNENDFKLENDQLSDNLIEMSYLQVQEKINNSWTSSDGFFRTKDDPLKFQTRVKSLLTKFLLPGRQAEFNTLAMKTHQEYIQKCEKAKEEYQSKEKNEKEQVTSQLISLIRSHFCKNQEGCKKGGCKQILIDEIKVQNFANFPRIDYSALKAHFETQKLELHYSLDSQLNSKLAELNQKLEKLYEDFNPKDGKSIVKLRSDLLRRFFMDIDTLVIKEKEIEKHLMKVSYLDFKINRDDFGISTEPKWSLIKKRCFTSELSETMNSEPKLKSILHITDKEVLVIISDFPTKGNDSIFELTTDSKQTVLKQFLTIESTSTMIVDPVGKHWCLYNNAPSKKSFVIGKFVGAKMDKSTSYNVYFDKNNPNSDISKHKISHILSASFVPRKDELILTARVLNNSVKVFNYNYKTCKLEEMFRREAVETEEADGTKKQQILKQEIRPDSDSKDFYHTVQVTSDGKYTLLQSQNQLDLYDITWKCIKTHKLNGVTHFKTFADGINNFYFIFDQDGNKTYQITDNISSKGYTEQLMQEEFDMNNGNPIIDYLYLAFRKFGPHSFFIGSPKQTTLHIAYDGKHEDLSSYIEFLGIPNIKLEVYNDIKNDNLQLSGDLMTLSTLENILISRVPIHLASIENGTLVPLQNGRNISNLINQAGMEDDGRPLVEKIYNLTKVGVFESVLQNYKDNIQVVSIVGKQTLGKSYGMNRLFGTRFNVAAMRCTDGIWMTLSVLVLKDGSTKMFLVMDCEGLFSERRTELEEMKLCLTLAAVSDVMILNQDLSFNRYFNQLFNNFAKGIGRIQGKCLFDGKLMMTIRDVSSDECEGAYLELESNFKQLMAQKDNFMSMLFDGELMAQCLNYFAQPIFDEEIDQVREKFFLSNQTKRWKEGITLLDTLKLVLAQVYLDDNTPMDHMRLKIRLENAANKLIVAWYQGGEVFEKECFVYKNGSIEISLLQKDVIIDGFSHEKNKTAPGPDFKYTKYIRKIFEDYFGYSVNKHDEWVTILNDFVDKLLEIRKNYLLNSFNMEFEEYVEDFKEEIEFFKNIIKSKIETIKAKSQLCLNKCQVCSRKCKLLKHHTTNCNCEHPKHLCHFPCAIPECTTNKNDCALIYGHDGNHKCKDGKHSCIKPCRFNIRGCPSDCRLGVDHDPSIPCQCGREHFCGETCEVTNCSKTCTYKLKDPNEIHTDHLCSETQCLFTCSVPGCSKRCILDCHSHENDIHRANTDPKAQERLTKNGRMLSYHVCGESHNCTKKCGKEGVCSVNYRIELRDWNNQDGSSFKYNYQITENLRKNCTKPISPMLLEHEGGHDCNNTHSCDEKCPDCDVYCMLPYTHSGNHSQTNHRNKDHNTFVSRTDSQIIIAVDESTRIYRPGQSCKAETCDSSCHRKGRAHYHLKECPGEANCPAKTNKDHYVRHSEQKYLPFTEKTFDLYLCHDYWQSFKWDTPVSKAVMEETINKCNFICGHPSHDNEHPSFCTKDAWHIYKDCKDKHEYTCNHYTSRPNYNPSLIDVVFTIDTTGSMSSYIPKVIPAINGIIKKASELKTPDGSSRDLKFGIVAYRDHPPQEVTYVTQVKDLTSQAEVEAFIRDLSAEGGGDIPEAVLDGLHDSVHKISWRENSLKFLFHVGDAPAHGTRFTNVKDAWPDGCPCGLSIDDIARDLKEKGIRYKCLKIGNKMTQMLYVFKELLGDNYDDRWLDNADQLDFVVSEIVVKEIELESSENDVSNVFIEF